MSTLSIVSDQWIVNPNQNTINLTIKNTYCDRNIKIIGADYIHQKASVPATRDTTFIYYPDTDNTKVSQGYSNYYVWREGTTLGGGADPDPSIAISTNAFTITPSKNNMLLKTANTYLDKIITINGAEYIKTVTTIPTVKDTSIILNSTNNEYYLWR